VAHGLSRGGGQAVLLTVRSTTSTAFLCRGESLGIQQPEGCELNVLLLCNTGHYQLIHSRRAREWRNIFSRGVPACVRDACVAAGQVRRTQVCLPAATRSPSPSHSHSPTHTLRRSGNFEDSPTECVPLGFLVPPLIHRTTELLRVFCGLIGRFYSPCTAALQAQYSAVKGDQRRPVSYADHLCVYVCGSMRVWACVCERA